MKSTTLFCGFLLACWPSAFASDRTFTVVTNSPMIDHWPGPDKFIGTPDDVVNAGLSTYQRSSPNQSGSYSYIVTTFGLTPDPWLFPPYDVITYVLGSTTIDTSVSVTNNVPLLKNVQFSGTELFPGHGPYSVQMTGRVGGTSSHAGNLYTFSSQFDFQGTFVAGTATATNATAAGAVVVLDAADYDAPDLTGVDSSLANYINTVAIPLAKSTPTAGLLCGSMTLTTAGSVPGIPGDTGYFPPLNCFATALAMDLSAATTGALKITSIQVTPEGLQIQWSPLAGATTYSMESTGALGSPFTALSSNLTTTTYVDRAWKNLPMQFYRVSAP
jgi:hypothetical protein